MAVVLLLVKSLSKVMFAPKFLFSFWFSNKAIRAVRLGPEGQVRVRSGGAHRSRCAAREQISREGAGGLCCRAWPASHGSPPASERSLSRPDSPSLPLTPDTANDLLFVVFYI